MPSARLRVDPQLWFLLRRDRRRREFDADVSGTDTVGHVVQMVGVPLTEVGDLRLDGEPVQPATRLDAGPGQAVTRLDAGPGQAVSRLSGGDAPTPLIDVAPLPRPQHTRESPPRFLLDVHLGSLARRLRLLGTDAAYESDVDDDHLVDLAARERRVLLTRDRGLLSRTALPEGALVRGSATEDQLEEVLTRFVPPLTPWTRCVRCNAPLDAVPAAEVTDELEPGTRRSYRTFSRCTGCGRVYWRGAHSGPLESIVHRAEAIVTGADGS